MTDLIQRAVSYATRAHGRIDHRRKYTNQPYDVHLKSVARIVAEYTDDQEMIAAAWLHDTVEDTSATFEDIEEQFGQDVVALVADVTDVSKVSDGNRAVRKAIDRAHLAQASPRAKTIKLADLIDNCRDITRNDEDFARVFCTEMSSLLEVLSEGHPRLYARAQKQLQKSFDQLGVCLPPIAAPTWRDRSPATPVIPHSQVQRLFVEAFSAKEIAEPLRSYDATSPAAEAAREMEARDLEVIGVREQGAVRGFALLADLGTGSCGEARREFRRAQVLEGDTRLSSVIEVLTRHDHCFISLLGCTSGVITRADIQKPVARMWLFGMITMTEMGVVDLLEERLPGDGWKSLLSQSRLEKAEELQAERRRRHQPSSLLECLQFSDKMSLLLEIPEMLSEFGLPSRRAAKEVIKSLESLRNNLAHAQDIVTHDWPQIARMTHRLEMRVISERERVMER
jgi:hypothetical protein